MAIGKFIHWLRSKQKTPLLPDVLWHETLASLPFLGRLNANELSRLRKLTEHFLAEKEFTPAGDLELTDAMNVSIAAQGCLLILNLGLESYRDWIGIIVYPDEFIIPRIVEDEFGVVHEYQDVASGEAWEGGPLLISWHDALMSGGGYNVVIHEFAHKLDMRNGEADGIPPLPPGLSHQEWETTLLTAYEDFCRRLEAADEHGREHHGISLIDAYASENPAEFFAVLSETFFETPENFLKEYPALYMLFVRFYRQNPATNRLFDTGPVSG